MDDFRQLITEAQKGNKEAKDEVVLQNSGLIHSVVRRFYGRGQDSEDLFQIGMIGLIKAVERFDLGYNLAFSTYAVPLIIGEIKRFLRDDGMIKVSRTMKETGYKVAKARQELNQELGREPTLYQVANYMGLSSEQVIMAVEANAQVDSIYQNTAPNVEEENFLIDQLASTENPQEKVFMKVFLELGMRKLGDVERKLIELRYYQDMTQVEVAKQLKMSQVQVSRMEKKILDTLKKDMV